MSESILHLDLYAVADRLEAATEAFEDTDEWYTGVEIHLLAYRSLVATHTATCSEDDLYHDVVERSPRVAPIVDRLRVECAKLDELAAFGLAALHAPNRSAGEVSARLRDLLRLTNRHRSRSIEVVHEAYAVDLGGPG